MDNGIQKAINYIEINLLNELDNEEIARMAGVPIYDFQRIFSSLCGISLGDYIRNRRLSQAALELLWNKEQKIIDVAIKYGYGTPESFSRAFKRFHGVLPSEVNTVAIHRYPPMSINITVKGECFMKHEVVQLEAFQVLCAKRLMPDWTGIWPFLQDFESNGYWDIFNKYHLYPEGQDPNKTEGAAPNESYGYVVNYEGYYGMGVVYNGKDYSEDTDKVKDIVDLIDIPAGKYVRVVMPSMYEGDIGNFCADVYGKYLSDWGYELTGGPELELTGGINNGDCVLLLPIK